jgi:hypothetical protein
VTGLGIFFVIFLLVWVGARVIIDVFVGLGPRRDRRPDLSERLGHYQPSLADEAQEWLKRH